MLPALASSPQPSRTSARCSSPCVTASSRKFELLGAGSPAPFFFLGHMYLGPLSSQPVLGHERRGSGWLVTDRVSVLVSLRFEISCVLLHFAALRLMAKPLRCKIMQLDALRCAAGG